MFSYDRQMTLVLLLVFGFSISRTDLQSQRIRNRDLNYFFIAAAAISLPDITRFARLTALTFTLSLFLSISFGIGMGDVKLISVLIPLLGRNHPLELVLLLSCISVTSTVAVAIGFARSRAISLRIPWAPSLFAASILYLATQ